MKHFTEDSRREVIQKLRAVKIRLRRNRLLRGAAAGLAAGLGAAALLQVAAFFVPVPDRGLLAAGIAAAAALLGALGNALRPVKNTDAAKAADACGLKERTITALEGGEEPIRLLQRRDACAALEKLDVKMIRPGSVKRALCAALGCAVLLGGLLLIPNPQDSAAAAQKALVRTLREGAKAIEKAAEEDEATLPEEKKNELRKIAEELNRELDRSRDAADALVALDRAEQRLEQFRQQTAGDAMNAANGAAGMNEGRADKAGENGRTGMQAPEGLSGQEGGSGQDGAGQQSSGQLAAAAAASGLTDAQMKTLQALAALKGQVNPSAAGGSQSGRSGMTGSKGGAGNGQGKGSNGAGEGSTNEEQKGGGGNGNRAGGEGTRDARYKEEKYETIYDPERIDKPLEDVMTDQFRLTDEDGLQIETGPGRGNLSGDVPWSDVLQDYADTEARSADRENLTVQERKWVNDYFSLLTEQNQ